MLAQFCWSKACCTSVLVNSFLGWAGPRCQPSTPTAAHSPHPSNMGRKQGLWARKSWVKIKSRKPLIKYHCRQNRSGLGNLIVFIVHEHKHLFTDSGIGKWMKKEVEQLKHLSSLLLRFNFSSSISPPSLVTAAGYPQAWLGICIWDLSATPPCSFLSCAPAGVLHSSASTGCGSFQECLFCYGAPFLVPAIVLSSLSGAFCPFSGRFSHRHH